MSTVDPQAVAVFLWSLLVLLSWIGLGSAAFRWAIHNRRPDVGLCAVGGMAATVLIGGVLNATRLCSPVTSVLVTVAGAGLSVWNFRNLFRRIKRRPFALFKRVLAFSPVWIYATVILIGSLNWGGHLVNYIDDLPFYLAMPLRMLQSGAAIDPMNARRLSTFGGYAFLQAQIFVLGNESNGHVVDAGLATIVVVMLLAGLVRRSVKGLLTLFALSLICWLYPMPRSNMMAAWATTAVLLGMIRTVKLSDVTPARRQRLLAIAACMAVAACTFRDNTLALPPLFFGLYFVDRFLRSPSQRTAVVREALIVMAVGIVVLLPWSIALHQAANSFLYPLMKGNHRTYSQDYAGEGLLFKNRIEFAMGLLKSSPFLMALLPVVFIVMKKDRTALFLVISAVGMSILTAFSFPVAAVEWVQRFCVPSVLAGSLIGVRYALQWSLKSGHSWAIAFMVAVSATFMLWTTESPVITARRQIYALGPALYGNDDLIPAAVRKAGADMQQIVPPGATIASVLGYPTVLNFGRNRVYCVDIPGHATVSGDWPFGQGPDALMQFLKAQGVDYVAFGNFEHSGELYSVEWWAPLARNGDRTGRQMLDMMVNLMTLAKTHPLLFDRDGLKLLRVP